MTTGVTATVLLVCCIVAWKSGRGLLAAVLAVAFGLLLASSTGPLSQAAKTLIDGGRDVLDAFSKLV